MPRLTWTTLLTTVLLLSGVGLSRGDDSAQIIPRSALLLPRLPSRTGEQLPGDPVEMIAIGHGLEPLGFEDQQTLTYGERTLKWQAVELNEQGGLDRPSSRRGGAYLYVPIESERDRVMLLSAGGGSGPLGMRAAQPISFFLPFTRYPDLLVLRGPADAASALQPLVAGYFGVDWSLENGESVRSDALTAAVSP